MKAFISSLKVLFIAFLLNPFCYLNADETTKTEVSVESWMDDWMSLRRLSGGALYFLKFKDPTYILTKEITWKPDTEISQLPEITVPKGFVTDLASIPPVFFSLLRPDGEYTHPAVIHDYLYWSQSVDRDTADEIFNLGMKEFDISDIHRIAIHTAVSSIFGEIAWNNNKKAKQNGEQKLLKKFPTDPRITWDEWKQRDGVF